MTGYAAAAAGSARGTLGLELRSINSRFLDLHFRITEELRATEPGLRELFSEKIGRGKLECRLGFVAAGASGNRELSVDTLERLAALQARVQAALPDAAPATPGVVGEQTFDWIADADSRLGPVLEAFVNGRYYWVPFDRLTRVDFEKPTDLRDMVWLPAQLTFDNGGEVIALVPSRYPGTPESSDGSLQLARKTEWRDAGHERWFGLGQRVFVSNAGEHDLLSLRSLQFDPPATAASAAA